MKKRDIKIGDRVKLIQEHIYYPNHTVKIGDEGTVVKFLMTDVDGMIRDRDWVDDVCEKRIYALRVRWDNNTLANGLTFENEIEIIEDENESE